MRVLMLASALALCACQSVKFNGVEITQGEQAKWGLLLAISAGVAYHLAQDGEDTPDKPQCKTFTSPSSDKGGVVTCAIPLD